MPAAMFFLRRAKDKFYNDPELHYLLAYIYYYNDEDYGKCEKALDTCLRILPEYSPAKKLLARLKNRILSHILNNPFKIIRLRTSLLCASNSIVFVFTI